MIYIIQNYIKKPKQKESIRDDSMYDDESTEHEEEYAQGIDKSTALFSDSMEEESDNDYLPHTESQSYTVPGGQDK